MMVKIAGLHLSHAFLGPAVAGLRGGFSTGDQVLQFEHTSGAVALGSMRMTFSMPGIADWTRANFSSIERCSMKTNTRVRMVEDVGNFRIGDIRAARYISASSEEHTVVAEHPLRPVVSQDAHMLARLQPKIDEGGGQGEAVFVKLAIADRLIFSRLIRRRRGRAGLRTARPIPG